MYFFRNIIHPAYQIFQGRNYYNMDRAETIRSFDHVTYYIFPKALGLFERGWNASPAWEGTEVSDDPAFVRDFNAFYSIIYDKELPYYQEKGIAYHIN